MNQDYKLSYLEINNFRQYKDIKITFSQDSEKNFTVIRGANGAGKTNIMNAITWCLYGVEKHFSDDERDLPIVHTKILENNQNAEVTVSVILVLADKNGDAIKIKRELIIDSSINTRIIEDPIVHVPIPEGSLIKINKTYQWYDPHKKGWESTNYFDKKIKELLPIDLVDYFLFDGEKLEDFIGQTSNTKKGIEDVSQIKIAEQAIETLSKLISQKRKGVKNLEPQELIAKEKMDRKEKEKVEKEKDLKQLKNELKRKCDKRDEIETKIRKFGGVASKHQKREITLRESIKGLEGKIFDSKLKLRNFTLKNMSSIMMLESLNTTIKYIREKTNDGVLPPDIRNTFVEELLDRGECICGRNISEGTESRNMVNKLLKKAQYSKIDEICNSIKYELVPCLKTSSIVEELDEIERDIISLEDNKKEQSDEFDDIKAKIGNVDNVDIKNDDMEKRQLEKSISEIERKIGVLEHEVGQLKQDYALLVKDYDAELRKDSKHKHLTRQLEFCNNALMGLQHVKNDLLVDVRNKVQHYTKQYFLKFLWKKDTYDGIKITDDYKIAAQMGEYDVRTGLSKGEKLVLALSFMSALRKITGFGFPLIIDTPLGRVSGEPRYNIAVSLPKFLKNTQVSLLVTDSEYQAPIHDENDVQKFPSIRNTINKYVGKEYTIIFTSGQSKIVMNSN